MDTTQIQPDNTDADGNIPDPDAIDPRTIAFIEAFCALWPDAEYGPAHILLSDYNVDDSFLVHCIQRTMDACEDKTGLWPRKSENDYSSHSMAELQATLNFLQIIHKIPEDKR